jgi:hypothetical protein
MQQFPGRELIGARTQRWTSPYEVCSNLDKHIVRVPD